MRWVGHEAWWNGGFYRMLLGGNLKETDCTRDLRVDGKTILMWMLKEWDFLALNWIVLVQDMFDGSILCTLLQTSLTTRLAV
jgi:hypothetical protein